MALGAGLCLAPASLQERLCAVTDDVLRPGLIVLRQVARRAAERQRPMADAAYARRMEAALDESRWWRIRAQQASARVLQLADELERMRAEQPAPFVGLPTAPLLVPELLEARVLRHFSEFGDDEETVTIDLGASGGAASAQWVLADDGLVADQGAEEDVAADDPILAGRTMFGRIASSGRWTSRIQHISEPGFKMHARLVRPSPNGPVRGAEGLLVGGGGNRCRLELIARTEPVEPGDFVYTAAAVPGVDEPLYLGKVVSVEMNDNRAHWTIDVAPGVGAADAERVQIIRVKLNSDRGSRRKEASSVAPWLSQAPADERSPR